MDVKMLQETGTAEVSRKTIIIKHRYQKIVMLEVRTMKKRGKTTFKASHVILFLEM